MATKNIRHDELKNGDVNWREGVRFEVQNLRIEPLYSTGDGPMIVRFEGRILEPKSLRGSGYDGGTYGARADVPATVEVCGHCGSRKVAEQSCGCFDNGCQ